MEATLISEVHAPFEPLNLIGVIAPNIVHSVTFDDDSLVALNKYGEVYILKDLFSVPVKSHLPSLPNTMELQ